jgi:hypothetical protein
MFRGRAGLLNPRADVVDVLVLVEVPRVRALDAVEDDRVAAHRLKGAHGRDRV